MLRILIATIVVCLTASNASAETLRCKQQHLSTNGFKSAKAARSWFPKNFMIQIDGEKAISDVYGLGSVEESDGRKKITFVTASSNNVRTEVKITFIKKTSIYTARLGALARYATTPGAKGQCSVS